MGRVELRDEKMENRLSQKGLVCGASSSRLAVGWRRNGAAWIAQHHWLCLADPCHARPSGRRLTGGCGALHQSLGAPPEACTAYVHGTRLYLSPDGFTSRRHRSTPYIRSVAAALHRAPLSLYCSGYPRPSSSDTTAAGRSLNPRSLVPAPPAFEPDGDPSHEPPDLMYLRPCQETSSHASRLGLGD